MKKVLLIRHGQTAGNHAKKYIGSTDESLSADGLRQVRALSQVGLSADHLYVSPMKRTLETAAILFPTMQYDVSELLRETDFGIFEGKSASELEDCAEYSAWLDTMCTGPIPGGEAVSDFKERCCQAFAEIMEAQPEGSSTAFVIHGGVIMAILERFARPQRDFYDYHIGNGEYVLCEMDAHDEEGGTSGDGPGVLRLIGGALC